MNKLEQLIFETVAGLQHKQEQGSKTGLNFQNSVWSLERCRIINDVISSSAEKANLDDPKVVGTLESVRKEMPDNTIIKLIDHWINEGRLNIKGYTPNKSVAVSVSGRDASVAVDMHGSSNKVETSGAGTTKSEIKNKSGAAENTTPKIRDMAFMFSKLIHARFYPHLSSSVPTPVMTSSSSSNLKGSTNLTGISTHTSKLYSLSEKQLIEIAQNFGYEETEFLATNIQHISTMLGDDKSSYYLYFAEIQLRLVEHLEHIKEFVGLVQDDKDTGIFLKKRISDEEKYAFKNLGEILKALKAKKISLNKLDKSAFEPLFNSLTSLCQEHADDLGFGHENLRLITNIKLKLIFSARNKALIEMRKEFNELGAYTEDKRYYFSETDTAKALSKAFLSKIYSDPDSSRVMLSAQAAKTTAIYKHEKEHIADSLAKTFYLEPSKIKQLLSDDDLDLFLLSPQVSKYQSTEYFLKAVSAKKEAPLSNADLKAAISKTDLEAAHLGLRKGVLASVSKNSALKSTLNDKLKLATSNTVDQHNWINAFFLDNNLAPSERQQSILKAKGANPVEKIYWLKQDAADQVETIDEKIKIAQLEFTKMKGEKTKDLVNQLAAAMNKVKEPDLDSAENIQKAFDKIKAQPEEFLKQLSEEDLKYQSANLINKQASNEVKQAINEVKKALSVQARLLVAQLDSVKLKEQTLKMLIQQKESLNGVKLGLKRKFLQDFYSGSQYKSIINDALKKTLIETVKEDESAESRMRDGGSYSCLGFIPVEIKPVNGKVRYECLVAISGVIPEEIKTVLSSIADKLRLTVDGKDFTFKFLTTPDPAWNLALKQFGKGLSGTPTPISRISDPDGIALPDFEKNCAEKALLGQLVAYYSDANLQVRVLGCDNIALPKHNQILKQSQLAASQAGKKKTKDLQFDISAKYKKDEKSAVTDYTLIGEHITCCSACQRQKPGFMIYLNHVQQESFKQRRSSVSSAPVIASCSNQVQAPITTGNKSNPVIKVK
jgi:hypothetical protein